MASTREIGKFLKPVIDRNNDLAYADRLLAVKPVRHFIRGVFVGRTASADCIKPRWLIHHLFAPSPDYHLSWGERLSGPRGYLWKTSDPEIQLALLEQIEKTALPILRSLETLGDFIAAVQKTQGGHLWSIDPFGKVVIDIAMGDLDSARVLCRDDICPRPDLGPKEDDNPKMRMAGAKTLCALLARDDIEGLVRQLHEWEARNVKHLKLEQYWKPTPFPIELKLGLA